MFVIREFRSAVTAFTCLLMLVATTAQADPYDDTIAVFKASGGSSAYFANAYGYAVFPTIAKAGVGIGGSRGSGRVYAQGKHIGDSTVTQLSIGLQLGGQASSEIIFFQDERALKDFTAGNFEFGAQATAVAITAGASAATTTTGTSASASGGRHDATTAGPGYSKGMATFTVMKGGLMYEASIGGQKFSYRAL